MCVIGGVLADIWNERERGLPMSIFSMTVFGEWRGCKVPEVRVTIE